MSWTDHKSIEHILKLRDEFDIRTFIETGTYKGTNLLRHRHNFSLLYGCEINSEYYRFAKKRLALFDQITLFNSDSTDVLKLFNKGLRHKHLMFYLDAHFYNPKTQSGANRERFAVLRELEALAGMDHSVLVIHDFDNGQFGHITYDGVSLDMNLLREGLHQVNPNFRFYTNTECDIVTEKDIRKIGLPLDDEMKSTLKFIHSSDEKRYRGILYALPSKVNIEGLREIK